MDVSEAIENWDMAKAVVALSSNLVEKLLDKGVGVNEVVDENGNTALHLASQTDKNLPCVKLLVERGANVYMQNTSDAMTPLHVASFYGNSEIVQFLISNIRLVNDPDEICHTSLYMSTPLGTVIDKYNIIIGMLINDKQVVPDKYGRTPLYYIWKSKNLYLIHMSLDTWLEDILDDQGNTFLHYAARDGDVRLAEHLLYKGRPVNKQNLDGQTALHIAVQSEIARECNIINLLIESGADMEITDFRGQTALVHAIMRVLNDGQSPEDLDLLIIKGATRENINSKDSISGQPLLHKIVECIGKGIMKKDSGTVLFEMLLKAGASVNIVDNQGNTALHQAVLYGEKLIIRKLLKTDIDVNLRNRSGKSAFHLALDFDSDIPFLFLGRYLQANFVCPKTGDMLLHKAVKSKSTNYLQQLVEVTTDLHRKNCERMSALHLAALKSYGIGVHVFLAHEIKSLSNEYEGRALFISILRRDKELLNKLLNDGCAVNCKDSMDRTALHWAVLRQFSYGVSILLSSGVDVNAQDRMGNTALHYAVLVNKEGILRELLTSGVDVNILDEDKRSALHFASFVRTANKVPNISGAYHMTVEQLVRLGSLLDLKDCNGNTPLHLAMMHDNYWAVDSLLHWEARADIRNKSGEFCFTYNVLRRGSKFATVYLVKYFIELKIAKLKYCKNHQLGDELEKCYRMLMKDDCYSDHVHNLFLESCNDEVIGMLGVEICGLCLYDVLFMKSSSLVFNSELRSAIFSSCLNEMFPNYGRILRNKFEIGELRQKRINESAGFQLSAMISDGSEVHLPVEVKFMIFSFLSDKDLYSIFRASY